jgi:hypothetical protein
VKKYGVLYGKEACTDRTTDETTSHSAMPPKDGDQAAGYSHLADETTSHSTDEATSHHTKQPKDGCQVIGYEYGRSVDGHKKVAIQRSTFVIDKQGKLRHALYGVHARGHTD